MAEFNKYIDELINHEKGYVDNPKDPGRATKYGITLDTWRRSGRDLDGDGDIDKNDVKLITKAMALPIYKKEYWDVSNLDKLRNQSIANMIFDHSVNASPYRAVRMAQEVLKTKFKVKLDADGVMGDKTLAFINSVNQAEFFKAYFDLRKLYYQYRANNLNLPSTDPLVVFFTSIKLKPSTDARAFIKGWLNRLNTFSFKVIAETASYVKENSRSVLNILLLCIATIYVVNM